MRLTKEQIETLNECARIMGLSKSEVTNIMAQKTAHSMVEKKLNELISGKGDKQPKGYLNEVMKTIKPEAKVAPKDRYCHVIIKDGKQLVAMPDGTIIPGVDLTRVTQGVEAGNMGQAIVRLNVVLQDETKGAERYLSIREKKESK